MRVVKSAFNEAIALKRKGGGGRMKRFPRVQKTHFLVYDLKTSRLIVQALIRLLIVILRAAIVSTVATIFFSAFDFIARLEFSTVV